MTRLAVSRLDQSAFAPFGRVIDQPRRAADADGPGWSWWGENELLPASPVGFGIGYLRLEPSPPRFDWAERHLHSPELVAPLDGECLVYTGPPGTDDQPTADGFQVFRVMAGQAVLLSPGVWHGAPLATSTPVSVLVLLQKGSGRADTVVSRFPDQPIEIDV
jgi:ureidoglycolate lyase